jgi:predicted Zn-dependent protease
MLRRLIEGLILLFLLFLCGGLLVMRFVPCVIPVRYSIGIVDPRFGISKEQLREAAVQAAAAWNTVVGKTLLLGVETGGLVIATSYDNRQQTRTTLKELGDSLDKKKNSFASVNEQYDALKATYDKQVAELRRMEGEYASRKRAYEAAAKGRLTEDEAERLDQQRVALNALADRINASLVTVRQTRDKVNVLVGVLNQIVSDEHLSYERAKEIRSTIGEEYEAGLYEREGFSQRITLFSFQGKPELVRLLMHEFGHAIGLQHVDDPQAVMYRLNQGEGLSLTSTDKKALQDTCTLGSLKMATVKP